MATWDYKTDSTFQKHLDKHAKSDDKATCKPIVIVLVGHSYGGYEAINRATWFRDKGAEETYAGKGIVLKVHLFTIDAIIPDTGGASVSPDPVKVGPTGMATFKNYWQDEDVRPSRFLSIYGHEISNAENTYVSEGDHTEIDDDEAPTISAAILAILGEGASP